MTRRAAAGAGSVYPRKRDGRQVGWTAMADLGVGPDGKRKRQAVYARTQAEARRKLNELLAQLQKGHLPRSGSITAEKWLQRWLEAIRPSVRHKTDRQYEYLVRVHLAPALGRKPLSRLAPSDVEAMLHQKHLEGLSPRTVHHLRAVLRNALRMAQRDGLLSRNVASLARPLPVPHRELQVLTPVEARRLLEDLDAVYLVALAMGLRQGEVLGLRWQDVDLEAGILRVAVQLQRADGQFLLTEPKSQQSRRILVMPEIVADALRQHRARERERQLASRVWLNEWDLAFTGQHGEPLEATGVTKRLQEILAAGGLPRLRFHDLRHSCASALIAAGVPMKTVSAMLGHSTISLTLNTYAHPLPEMQREAAEAMTRILRG